MLPTVLESFQSTTETVLPYQFPSWKTVERGVEDEVEDKEDDNDEGYKMDSLAMQCTKE